MKKLSLLLVLLMSSLLVLADDKQSKDKASNDNNQTTAENREEAMERLQEAGATLSQLMGAPDQAIPETVLKDAKCVAVVPSMVKGGFVFGARHGRGVATCRTESGWSAPAFFTVTGGNWGAQIGVEAVDLVMLIMNEEGMKNLLSSNWTMSGDASVAAGPVRRQAQAETDYKMKAQVLTYSRARGLYAGATLNGAKIRPDKDSTKAFYGKEDVPFNRILMGEVRAPQGANPFLASVRQTFREASARR